MYKLYKSFSFKLSAICFAVFLALMLIFYYMVYNNILEQSTAEIEEIVTQEFTQIDKGIEKKGRDYGLNLINMLLDSDKHNNLIVSYFDKHGRSLEGNIDKMPEYENFHINFIHIYLENEEYIGKLHKYPNGATLFLAHNSRHLERIEEILHDAFAKNIIFSVLAASLCSAIVAYLINRKLRSINSTCDDLISGNLQARVKTDGDYDQFSMLANNLNRMLSWIENLVDNIKNTATSIAHDIKTPLNHHRQRLEKLARNGNEEIAEAIAELDKISTMFESILNISKAESKIGRKYFEEINLTNLANEVCEIYEVVAEDKKINLAKDLPDNITIQGHKQLLAQAISNLLDNAIKYTPKEGKVEIVLLKADNQVRIEIRDNGIGIAEQYYDKITEKFFRLDKSRSTQGIGLGLSLVEAVVKLHDGRLEFKDNNPGLSAAIILPS